MMIITETQVGGNKAKEITDRLSFDGAAHADTVGYAGGIWVLQNTEVMDVPILASIEQEIPAAIKVHSSNLSWLITVIYASLRYRERHILWDNLNQVATLHNLPWLVLGDFNEILSSENKLGGRPINIHRAMVFQQCLNSCNLLDLGFQGPKFTWVNKRDFPALIQERIDHCFANSS